MKISSKSVNFHFFSPCTLKFLLARLLDTSTLPQAKIKDSPLLGTDMAKSFLISFLAFQFDHALIRSAEDGSIRVQAQCQNWPADDDG